MESQLKRTLGFWSCLAVGVGLVVASTTLVSLGQGMGIAGGGFLLAMIVAWLLQFFTAMSFGELACMMPRAGGISSYTQAAMGTLPAIVATICGYVVINLLAGPAELAVAGFVFNGVFAPSFPPMIFSLIMLAVLVVFNVLGVDIFAKAQMVFTAIMILSMSALGIIGLLGMGAPAPAMPAMPFNPMGMEVFSLIALAIWLYIGIEFVCPMAEETIEPEKNIPKAMFIGLGIIFVVNLLYGFASIKYIPLDRLAESANPHVDVAAAILGRSGEIWIGIVSLAATASSVNTLVGVIPRMLYGMAQDGEAPSFLAAIHPRFRTPWISILLMGGAMGGVLLSGVAGIEQIVIFIMAAALSWLVAYIIAHLDVIILRVRHKEIVRPYKTPFFPIPQVLGIAGMVFVILNIFPDPITAAEIYKFGLILIGLAVVYAVLWIKLVMKKPLFEPVNLQAVAVQPAGAKMME
jgi:amino acid transporter